MKTQLRIVAGSLRGRKLTCDVNGRMRPAPQRVREALFSILGDAIPGRPFVDLFAGTGAVGLEALSRGAAPVTLVERDFHTASQIESHLRAFGVGDAARVVRADVYRWMERWEPPAEPVNVFLGPPYPDLERRGADLGAVLLQLQVAVAPGSLVVLQTERLSAGSPLPGEGAWEERRYGRNHLWIWLKEGFPDAVRESE
jgi:16S rRNA (guanine(966)-N(2))-methyltransferase RsmD